MNGNKEMATSIETLMLDLVDWTIERERTCGQLMPAWRKSHADLPFWDEPNRRGLIQIEIVNRRCVIKLTSLGLILSKRMHDTRSPPPSEFENRERAGQRGAVAEDAALSVRVGGSERVTAHYGRGMSLNICQ